jgi:D-amino peptidase
MRSMVDSRQRALWVVLVIVISAILVAAQSSPAKANSSPSKARPRVLVYYDMEGLAGQADWRTASFLHTEYYKKGQEMLAADVNAVVDGLAAGGAAAIDVVDAHGSGNPDPDLPPARLDPRAHTVFRDHPFDPSVDLVGPGLYEAVVAVGMHSKTSTSGFLAHTFEIGCNISLNGRWITETEFIGYAWGQVRVPVIFVSGDDLLAQDLQTMPWLHYVTVKHATGTLSADLLPVDQVHDQMRREANQALQELGRARIMRLRPPIQVTVHASSPANLAMLKGVPGVRYKDQSVSFVAGSFREASSGIEALVNVATRDFSKFVLDELSSLPESSALERKSMQNLLEQYSKSAKQRWTSPPAVTPRAAHDGRYYGDR